MEVVRSGITGDPKLCPNKESALDLHPIVRTQKCLHASIQPSIQEKDRRPDEALTCVIRYVLSCSAQRS